DRIPLELGFVNERLHSDHPRETLGPEVGSSLAPARHDPVTESVHDLERPTQEEVVVGSVPSPASDYPDPLTVRLPTRQRHVARSPLCVRTDRYRRPTTSRPYRPRPRPPQSVRRLYTSTSLHLGPG